MILPHRSSEMTSETATSVDEVRELEENENAISERAKLWSTLLICRGGVKSIPDHGLVWPPHRVSDVGSSLAWNFVNSRHVLRFACLYVNRSTARLGPFLLYRISATVRHMYREFADRWARKRYFG